MSLVYSINMTRMRGGSLNPISPSWPAQADRQRITFQQHFAVGMVVRPPHQGIRGQPQWSPPVRGGTTGPRHPLLVDARCVHDRAARAASKSQSLRVIDAGGLLPDDGERF